MKLIERIGWVVIAIPVVMILLIYTAAMELPPLARCLFDKTAIRLKLK